MEDRPTARFRPVTLVEDLDDTAPTRGRVRLPLHIRWSGPEIDYDLEDPRELRSVYEQVLREGNEDDIRRFVNASKLIEVWDDLILPAHFRAAWEPWVSRRRLARRS